MKKKQGSQKRTPQTGKIYLDSSVFNFSMEGQVLFYASQNGLERKDLIKGFIESVLGIDFNKFIHDASMKELKEKGITDGNFSKMLRKYTIQEALKRATETDQINYLKDRLKEE